MSAPGGAVGCGLAGYSWPVNAREMGSARLMMMKLAVVVADETLNAMLSAIVDPRRPFAHAIASPHAEARQPCLESEMRTLPKLLFNICRS